MPAAVSVSMLEQLQALDDRLPDGWVPEASPAEVVASLRESLKTGLRRPEAYIWDAENQDGLVLLHNDVVHEDVGAWDSCRISPRTISLADTDARRRTRARRRAASTVIETGLVRKSSAPASSRSTWSKSPDLAVSTRMGVSTPSERSASQTLYPDEPGNKRSNTMAP